MLETMGTLYSFKERIDLVKELAALGNSERQIAGRMNMPRNQVRKLLGKCKACNARLAISLASLARE